MEADSIVYEKLCEINKFERIYKCLFLEKNIQNLEKNVANRKKYVTIIVCPLNMRCIQIVNL